MTIPETDCSMKVEASEYDGKVVYGEKRSEKGKLTNSQKLLIIITRIIIAIKWVGIWLGKK